MNKTNQWRAYLEQNEVEQGFIFLQQGANLTRRETYAEFSPAEMEDERPMVESVLTEAHVEAHSRNAGDKRR